MRIHPVIIEIFNWNVLEICYCGSIYRGVHFCALYDDYNHVLSQYTIHWVNKSKASLTDSQYTWQSRRLWQITHSVCCSCNFLKHLPWLKYQLWFLSLFTLYPNRLAVFTSRVIILPFIAAKKATSTGFCRNKRPCQCLKLRAQCSFYFPYFWCHSGISVTQQAYNNMSLNPCSKYLICIFGLVISIKIEKKKNGWMCLLKLPSFGNNLVIHCWLHPADINHTNIWTLTQLLLGCF